MFDNDRYITIGIQNKIPLELQLLMWTCIDTLKKQDKMLDYLQVFEFTKLRIDDFEFQSMEHRQEVPSYNKTYDFIPIDIDDVKTFVIDDGDHSTMMLAEEY